MSELFKQATLDTPGAREAAKPAPAKEFDRLLEKDHSSFSAFGSIDMFKDAQRMAQALCSSSIVPESYRGTENLGNCVIALEIANRIGASVLAVMQNLYIVHGKPAWSSQFLISCVNATRRFTSIRYEETGNRDDDSWGCVAWAMDKTGERLRSPEITIGMAKAEGWFGKNGSKWKTMPELMLRYRAATLWARLFAPELTMGIQTDDEVVDIAPVVTDPVQSVPPAFGTTPRGKKQEPAPAPSDDDGDLGPQTPKEKAPAPTESERPINWTRSVRGLIKLGGHSEVDLIKWLRETGKVDESLGSIEEICKVQPAALVWTSDNWSTIDKELKRLKGGAK